ncbi:hypothetical protein J2X43_003763 [Rhizobium sp. BE258]|nr:hypothetical protein [Rhizobium sp. BE258]
MEKSFSLGMIFMEDGGDRTLNPPIPNFKNDLEETLKRTTPATHSPVMDARQMRVR